jgi:LacI family transcriptional regulator
MPRDYSTVARNQWQHMKNPHKPSAVPGGPRVARLIDIARLADVSVSTAGRVMRGSSLPVAPAVAERVNEAARQLGYVPNIHARNLRGAQPKMVGLVVGHMLDPYYGSIAEAVTQRAESEHGMLAIVCNMQRDPLLELKYCRLLWEHRVAGLVLSGGGFDQQSCAVELASLIRDMVAAGVVVTSLVPRAADVPVFSVDNAQAGRAAARHLVQAGHRHIGLLAGSAGSETARQRLAGSLAVLAEHGVSGTVRHAEFSAPSVSAALQALRDEQPGISAILAGSDFMARAAVEWMAGQGIAVPQAMSVIGIGGAEQASLPLRLTSIDIRLAECSSAALDYIAAGSGAPVPRFEARLIAGETVAVPP